MQRVYGAGDLQRNDGRYVGQRRSESGNRTLRGRDVRLVLVAELGLYDVARERRSRELVGTQSTEQCKEKT